MSDRLNPNGLDNMPETGSVSGQIGGEIADFAAGLVRIEHTFIDHSPLNPEPGVIQSTDVGGFVVTADQKQKGRLFRRPF